EVGARHPCGPENGFPVAGLHNVAAVAIAAQNFTECIQELRLAIGSQRHDLVFIRRMKKAEVAGEILVQKAQRMRQKDLLEPSVLPASEMPVAGGGALATPVHRQHCRFFEGSSEEGAGLMTKVVLQ